MLTCTVLVKDKRDNSRRIRVSLLGTWYINLDSFTFLIRRLRICENLSQATISLSEEADWSRPDARCIKQHQKVLSLRQEEGSHIGPEHSDMTFRTVVRSVAQLSV